MLEGGGQKADAGRARRAEVRSEPACQRDAAHVVVGDVHLVHQRVDARPYGRLGQLHAAHVALGEIHALFGVEVACPLFLFCAQAPREARADLPGFEQAPGLVDDAQLEQAGDSV